MRSEIAETLRKLEWMRSERIWPNGPRYLWTDAFGVVLLVSLADELGEDGYLREAEGVVAEVGRVLGRPRGIRIGEAPDRDGQYFHYLAMWLFALHVLAERRPGYRPQAIEVVRQIHPRFVRPGIGVIWKMREDLSAPYPGSVSVHWIRFMATWSTGCWAKRARRRDPGHAERWFSDCTGSWTSPRTLAWG